MLARLEKAAAPEGCSQDGRGAIEGGLSLQSLLQMSHGCARFARGGKAVMPAEPIGLL
jgi:hypothetical protein